MIVGHTDSKANRLWEELNFLQHCINVSKITNLEVEELNTCGNCLDDLNDTVFHVLNKDYRIKKMKKQQRQELLDFNNLREASVTDELWKILRSILSLLIYFYI